MGEMIPLNIALPTFSSTLTAKTTPTTNLPAILNNLPESLSKLSRPITINGTVLSLLENNEATLRTAFGRITLSLLDVPTETLKTLAKLLDTPTGRSPIIDLTLEAGSPPQKAVLIFKTNDLSKSSGEKHLEAMAPLTTGKQSGNFAEGQTVKLTLLSEKVPDTTPQAQLVQTRTIVQAHVQNSPLIAQDDTPTPAASSSRQAEQTGPQTAKTAAKLPKISLPQASVQLKVEQLIAPDHEWPHAVCPPLIKAIITAKSPSGQPIIQSEGKTFFVHENTDCPVGTKILGMLSLDKSGVDTLLPLDDNRNFTPLREMVAALQQADPTMAKSFLTTQLPTPQQNFAGTILFFLSALNTGKVDEWLGRPMLDKLERNQKTHFKNNLIDALDKVLSQNAHDTRVGEWHTYPIPLHCGQAFEMLRLYVHNDSGQQDGGGNGEMLKKTRFVISMNMSRLGPIQMDGLAQSKQLDLVIRSERNLPEHLAQQIRATALPALEAVGLVGTILFQSGRQNWVSIEDNALDAQDNWLG